MKTLYEKAQNICSYVRDIMYMQKYYMDVYESINVRHNGTLKITPLSWADKIRSYTFNTNSKNETTIFQTIKRDTDYNCIYSVTLTNSTAHIKNNTSGNKPKYTYVQNCYQEIDDYIRSLGLDSRELFNSLRNGISTNTIRETEFQMQMIYDDHLMTCYYMMMLLNEDLNNIQYINNDTVLCVGSIDILTLVPARKAFIDLLEKRAPNDWRETIRVRYGHTIG